MLPSMRGALIGLPLVLGLSGTAPAAPRDDASAVVARWSAAFNAGDLDGILQTYIADATVQGTTSASLAVGGEGLRAYFAPAFRSRNQVKLAGDEVATELSADAVVLAGFYEFSGTRPDGQAFTAPARYSFVVVRRPDGWRIAHQHSSPRPRPVP